MYKVRRAQLNVPDFPIEHGQAATRLAETMTCGLPPQLSARTGSRVRAMPHRRDNAHRLNTMFDREHSALLLIHHTYTRYCHACIHRTCATSSLSPLP